MEALTLSDSETSGSSIKTSSRIFKNGGLKIINLFGHVKESKRSLITSKPNLKLGRKTALQVLV